MVDFVAEVSSNHSQDINRCKDFIKVASNVGCSGVKFQLFKIEKLFSAETIKSYPNVRKRKKWELPIEFIPELSSFAHELGLQFSCTPFYLDAVKELEDYVDFFKIASYELLWNDLFIECAKTGKPLVFSTGMATIDEIKSALNSIKDFKTKNITILKCTSAYPTPHNEANLAAITTLKRELEEFSNYFDLSYGYSDHTVSENVISRAVHQYNCDFIEFHLDLDGKGEEFESGHCWLPNHIESIITRIKKDFETDGDGKFGPTKSEINDRNWRADPADGLRPLKKIRNNK